MNLRFGEAAWACVCRGKLSWARGSTGDGAMCLVSGADVSQEPSQNCGWGLGPLHLDLLTSWSFLTAHQLLPRQIFEGPRCGNGRLWRPGTEPTWLKGGDMGPPFWMGADAKNVRLSLTCHSNFYSQWENWKRNKIERRKWTALSLLRTLPNTVK